MTGQTGETGEHMVDAQLVGGPAHFSDSLRAVRIPAAAVRQRIKVEYSGGYRHFEPFDAPREGVGGQPTTLRRTGFTRIAE
ncbi:DUF5988 family protein [Streptomyces sp. NBC_00316]|uniref:DUF5988 family protein n=1 Tax=Streptomyces sp. NBC_00316 TaxID=2975710 RepID=UPI002E2D768D|nr:DUF5988 family protein [Streptomyces sp. NBC_00316]